MNLTFDAEVWRFGIVGGCVVLLAVLIFWLICELRASRREQHQNTELLRLWLLAFDSARKSGDVLPVCEPLENLNDNVLK